jgi:hypothetical protein
MTFGITTIRITRLSHYGDCHVLCVVMLNDIMLSVIMLSVVMLSVVASKIISGVKHVSLFQPGSVTKIKKFDNIDDWST